MKKIAIVSDAVYPFNKGGKEKRIHEISRRLAAEGHDVTIYCMKWWKEPVKEITQDGVKLHAISPLYPLYTHGRRSTTEAVLFGIHCLKLIWMKFDVIEVDCVPHFQLFSAKLVCLLRGKKMFASWHEVWGKEYWKLYLGTFGYLAYIIERLSVMMPDVIISVSEHTTRSLRSTLHASQKIVTIPNGLDIKEITKNEPSKHASDIVFAGRLLAHKNVDILLHAAQLLAQRMPRMKLFIVGDGPERYNLQKLARTLGIEKNVTFFGFLEDHDELYSIMRASKLFVLPSSREGFGIAVIEANACGLPVITVDHEQNAAAELIVGGADGNGAVCELDADHLAQTMEKLLRVRQPAAIYLQYAERYNWDRLIKDIHKTYVT